MSTRKFYKTVIQITVLSEDPFQYENLSDVHEAITTGDCSGKVETISAESILGKEMANALKAQGSHPEFFMLTRDGEDIE